MLKRTLVLAALVFAVSVPAAFADNGAPPAAGGSAGAAAAPRAGNPAQLQQRLELLRQRIERATAAFAKHCVTGRVDTAKCTEAAKRMLAVLQRIDGRIDALVARIQQRCSGATEQAVPKACGRADQFVQALRDAQSKLRKLEQKLQDWLANPPAPSSGSSTSGSSTTGSSAGDDGLESIGKLAADLAAARAAAGASGL